mmetsp:Transcript_44768/g.72946  ORF Transcript_44768/g.72946 Transcript_44768/m.72946 type:complete len:220 (-) Transcript_44768:16-675(-)
MLRSTTPINAKSRLSEGYQPRGSGAGVGLHGPDVHPPGRSQRTGRRAFRGGDGGGRCPTLKVHSNRAEGHSAEAKNSGEQGEVLHDGEAGLRHTFDKEQLQDKLHHVLAQPIIHHLPQKVLRRRPVREHGPKGAVRQCQRDGEAAGHTEMAVLGRGHSTTAYVVHRHDNLGDLLHRKDGRGRDEQVAEPGVGVRVHDIARLLLQPAIVFVLANGLQFIH